MRSELRVIPGGRERRPRARESGAHVGLAYAVVAAVVFWAVVAVVMAAVA